MKECHCPGHWCWFRVMCPQKGVNLWNRSDGVRDLWRLSEALVWRWCVGSHQRVAKARSWSGTLCRVSVLQEHKHSWGVMAPPVVYVAPWRLAIVHTIQVGLDIQGAVARVLSLCVSAQGFARTFRGYFCYREFCRTGQVVLGALCRGLPSTGGCSVTIGDRGCAFGKDVLGLLMAGTSAPSVSSRSGSHSAMYKAWATGSLAKEVFLGLCEQPFA